MLENYPEKIYYSTESNIFRTRQRRSKIFWKFPENYTEKSIILLEKVLEQSLNKEESKIFRKNARKLHRKIHYATLKKC